MSRRRHRYGLGTLLLIATGLSGLELPAVGSQTQPPFLAKAIEHVDALAAAELAQDNIGGINIGIVSGGQLVWTKSYGYADTEKKIPVSKDTVYRIASITKQFTALMLLQLVEQGTVRLSDPVEKYLPEVNQLQNSFRGAPPITLIQLATHTAGVDREPNDDDVVYGKGPVSEWEKQLRASIPLTRYEYEPGTRYFYSNIGYAMLGLALSRAAGEPYVEYIQRRILKPLGMTQTGFVLDERMQKNRAKGFLIEDGKVDAEEPERQERVGRGWRLPNGGLYSTMDDVARWVAFESGAEENAAVLNKKTLEGNFARVQSANTDFSYGYGLGFQVRRRGDFVAVGHDGVLAGYQCSAWFNSKTRLGVITMTTRQEKFLGFRALEVITSQAAGK